MSESRTDSSFNSPAATGSLVILAAVALGASLYFMRPVLVPLVLAILVSYLVSPLVDLVQVKLRTPRPLAVVVALLAAAVILALLGLLISSSVSNLADKGPLYEQKILSMVDQASALLEDWGIPIDAASIKTQLSELPIADMMLGTLNSVVNSLSNFVLVLILVIYLVAGRTPNTQKTGIYREIDSRIKRYINVKVAASAATGLLTGVILALFGLDLAVVFGLLAFLLNFIPSVGSVVAVILPLPVALVQFDSTLIIALCVALPGVVQFTIGQVLEPRFMGTALSLHPITILLSLVFWGMLWGVTGMLLAAPITAVIKIVLDRIEATRPIGALLAGELPES